MRKWASHFTSLSYHIASRRWDYRLDDVKGLLGPFLLSFTEYLLRSSYVPGSDREPGIIAVNQTNSAPSLGSNFPQEYLTVSTWKRGFPFMKQDVLRLPQFPLASSCLSRWNLWSGPPHPPKTQESPNSQVWFESTRAMRNGRNSNSLLFYFNVLVKTLLSICLATEGMIKKKKFRIKANPWLGQKC